MLIFNHMQLCLQFDLHNECEEVDLDSFDTDKNP